MPMRIDWEGLIVGFESRSQKITHFFDRETGLTLLPDTTAAVAPEAQLAPAAP